MGESFEEFWANVPKGEMEPTRVKVLKALRRIGRPLSARQLVDVFDGDVSMWEAARHLSALEALGVVEAVEGDAGEERPREDECDVPFRLDQDGASEDG